MSDWGVVVGVFFFRRCVVLGGAGVSRFEGEGGAAASGSLSGDCSKSFWRDKRVAA